MHKYISRLVLAIACLTSSLALAGPPSGSAYLDGGMSKVGVILCHGRGQYPTWKVVDPLRKGIHDKLGYHTLSLQMPANKKKWQAYARDFPRAHKEIEAGIAFLRDEKKVEHIYLMGHSMGSRMATSYLASNLTVPIEGFIGVGIRNGGGEPLDSKANLRQVALPVVDIYGDGGDGKDMKHATARSGMVSDRYKQVFIHGANHTFDDHEREMIQEVIDWLSERP
jgi:pimeloyl-ACP methyl ester carboxylesterase